MSVSLGYREHMIKKKIRFRKSLIIHTSQQGRHNLSIIMT